MPYITSYNMYYLSLITLLIMHQKGAEKPFVVLECSKMANPSNLSHQSPLLEPSDSHCDCDARSCPACKIGLHLSFYNVNRLFINMVKLKSLYF